jgi:hypothetical protein
VATETVPADIAAAIRQLESAAWVDGNVETVGTSEGRKVARAALDAAILALVRDRDELKAALALSASGGV